MSVPDTAPTPVRVRSSARRRSPGLDPGGVRLVLRTLYRHRVVGGLSAAERHHRHRTGRAASS